MRILNILLTGLFVSLLNTTAQARMTEELIACPSVDTIRQIAPLFKDASIDILGDDLYSALIPHVEANGIYWDIFSFNIIAKSPKKAAVIAQKLTSNVTQMVYQNARIGAPRGDENSCLYYDGTQLNPDVSVQAIYSQYNTRVNPLAAEHNAHDHPLS